MPSAASREHGTFPASLTEADVRRLCGAEACALGDSWEREGHVSAPRRQGATIAAEIRGTWKALESATATASGTRLESDCSCRAGPFCRHVAALLLHWVRNPSDFVRSPDGEDHDDSHPDGGPETSEDQLARLLAHDNAGHLREIARRRGIRVVARNKGELVERLATALAEPEGIREAVGGLRPEARLLLDVTDLVGAVVGTSSYTIATAYRALHGGTGEGPVDELFACLHDLGLVVLDSPYGAEGYRVPAAVAAHLPPLDGLIATVSAGRPSTTISAAPRATLGLLQVLQVIVYEMAAGRIGHEQVRVPAEDIQRVPPGWRIVAREALPASVRDRFPYGVTEVQLQALPPVVSTADLEHLTGLTGASERRLDFALKLLVALGVLRVVQSGKSSRWIVQPDGLQSMLRAHPADRLAYLVQAWWAIDGSFEFARAVAPGGPLQLHYRTASYSVSGLPFPQVSAVRRLIGRIVGRLPGRSVTDGDSFDVSSLLDAVYKLAPGVLTGSALVSRQSTWWFMARPTGKTRALERLEVDDERGWRRVMSPLVASILSGPMTWLGLVEVIPGDGGLAAFRPGPLAGVLADRRVDDVAVEVPAISIADKLDGALPQVTLAAGNPPDIVSSFVADIGTLTGISPEGLHYRVSRDNIVRLFGNNVTGPEILDALGDFAGGSVPAVVRETIEAWWREYGTVRLYDDVTLVELGDDALLPELLATSSLSQSLVYTLSPRIVAVNPSRVADLIAELTRLGYTPREISGA